jgi:hypothetical protein
MFILTVLSFSVVLIALALSHNLKRANRVLEVDLLPNCLLTRYPIVFISGQRTLFHFLDYWNHIPIYLSEHGYEVIELTLPWRNRRQQTQALRSRIEQLPHPKIHLFVDQSLDIDELKLIDNPKVASITVVENQIRSRNTLRVSDLMPNALLHTIQWDPHDPRKLLSIPGQWAYFLHSLLIYPQKTLEAVVLHPFPKKLAQHILEHTCYLAERDYQNESGVSK